MVILFIVLVGYVVIPKIVGQFTMVPQTAADAAVGFIAVGCLLGVWLCATTLFSCFWFQIARWFRIFSGVMVLCLVVGFFVVSETFSRSPYGNPVSSADVLKFYLLIAAFTMPVINGGYGYPGLVHRLFSRFSRGKE